MARTAFIKLVDFHLVDVAESRRLAQLYVLAVLGVPGNDGWLPILRVGIPKQIRITL